VFFIVVSKCVARKPQVYLKDFHDFFEDIPVCSELGKYNSGISNCLFTFLPVVLQNLLSDFCQSKSPIMTLCFC
jgi:hypothetical protein